MKKVALIFTFVFVAGLGMSTQASNIILDNGLHIVVVDNDKKPCPEGCTCDACKAKASNAKGADVKTADAKSGEAKKDCSAKKEACKSADAKKGCCKKTAQAEPSKSNSSK